MPAHQTFTPAEIVRAAKGAAVPGLATGAGGWAPPRLWESFCEARQRGYVTLATRHWAELGRVWTAWCVAHRLPRVELHERWRGDGCDAVVEPGSAGVCFTPTALIPLGQACRRLGLTDGSADRWLLSPTRWSFHELGEEAAHALAAALVEIATDLRCVVPEPPTP